MLLNCDRYWMVILQITFESKGLTVQLPPGRSSSNQQQPQPVMIRGPAEVLAAFEYGGSSYIAGATREVVQVWKVRSGADGRPLPAAHFGLDAVRTLCPPPAGPLRRPKMPAYSLPPPLWLMRARPSPPVLIDKGSSITDIVWALSSLCFSTLP